jgi:hypothetical protein
MRISGLRDGAQVLALPTCEQRRHQPNEAHQLACSIESGEVPQLGNQGGGDDEGDSSMCHECLHDELHRPRLEEIPHLVLEPLHSFARLLDSAQVLLEADLLRRLVKALSRNPLLVQLRPAGLPWVVPAMA